jgi:hypothetical protein
LDHAHRDADGLSVLALPAPEGAGRIDYWDEKVAGLVLKTCSRGSNPHSPQVIVQGSLGRSDWRESQFNALSNDPAADDKLTTPTPKQASTSEQATPRRAGTAAKN